MKKLIAGLGIATVAALAAPALANNTVSNIKDDSAAKIFSEIAKYVNVTNVNESTVANTVITEGSTGGNDIFAKDGVKKAAIVSGDVVAATSLDTKANTILSKVDVDASCDCIDNSVSGVDDESWVLVYSKNKLGLNHTNLNSGAVLNTVANSGKTGKNAIGSYHDDVEDAGIATGTVTQVTEIWNMVGTVSAETTVR